MSEEFIAEDGGTMEALHGAAVAARGIGRYPGCYGHGPTDAAPVVDSKGVVCCPMCRDYREGDR